MARHTIAVAALGTTLGCTPAGEDPDLEATPLTAGEGESGTGPITGAGSSSGSPVTTGDATGGTTGSGSSSTGGSGCSNVDFIFVVDNSPSMMEEQAALVAAFPDFIATIENTLPASGFHVMVVDTDAGTLCMSDENACQFQMIPLCEGPASFACTEPFDQCDSTLGAGVVKPAGQGASNVLCDLDGDRRFLTETHPQLADAFSCVATVGLAGSPTERPLDAILASVSPTLQGEGGCNEGFLRSDAILVVTFITDDSNTEDFVTPQNAHSALISAKAAQDDAVVVLGLIPDPENGCGEGEAGAHWAEFIDLFGDNGIRGSVCQPNYDTFFQEAVATIDAACGVVPGLP